MPKIISNKAMLALLRQRGMALRPQPTIPAQAIKPMPLGETKQWLEMKRIRRDMPEQRG